VLFLCHAKPKDAEQAAVWKKLVENTLESPDTWEVALSAGKDKRENFERLLREGKLGGLAALRNLRLMLASGVEPKLIRERLDHGVARALPFRFVTAARRRPKLWTCPARWTLQGLQAQTVEPGSSRRRARPRAWMQPWDSPLYFARRPWSSVSRPSRTLAWSCRRGAGSLRDAIVGSQEHSGTYLRRALESLRLKREWRDLECLIVITDEQSHDGNPAGVDGEGVRSERGPVKEWRELRNWLDAFRRLVGADR